VSGAVWLPIDTLPTADVRDDVPAVVALAWQHLTATSPTGTTPTGAAGRRDVLPDPRPALHP
jgi:hypothetical protein